MTLLKLRMEADRLERLKARYTQRSRRWVEIHAQHVKLKAKLVLMEVRAEKANSRKAA